MRDWDLVVALSSANNKGEKAEVYRIIGDTDFSEYPIASSAAINCINLIREEVDQHRDALLNFTNTVKVANLTDIRDLFRFKLLKDLLGPV